MIYDVVIIGSGIGGLVCADILGKEGYVVCVLEKNRQIGGCLQTYVRDKVIFDSGVHYLGGLSKGQTLYQLFKYLNIMDHLKLEQMDMNAFDKIIIENDEKEYAYAQGYENFLQRLLADFPEEEQALRIYCDTIKEVCSKFPLYNLRSGGDISEKTAVWEIETRAFIESITPNKKLQAVLVGNNMLYALQSYKTPFYVHALILNSYIESAWKCVDGGSAIGRLLAKNIRANRGAIFRNSEVTQLLVDKDQVTSVRLANGTMIYGKNFISNLHPAKTMELLDASILKPAYKSRIAQLQDSVGCFVVNLVLKKESYPYVRHNYYYHREGSIWTMADYTSKNWPLGYGIFFSASSKSGIFAEAVTIFTYMHYSEVMQWDDSVNTVSKKEDRGAQYEQFKQEKAQRLMQVVEEKFPGLSAAVKSVYTATPLTYRDYIGTSNGSMYGIAKDATNPYKTIISARTQISNLYLTGQNLNLHGILGTCISAVVTCNTILGHEEVVEKIKNA